MRKWKACDVVCFALIVWALFFIVGCGIAAPIVSAVGAARAEMRFTAIEVRVQALEDGDIWVTR